MINFDANIFKMSEIEAKKRISVNLSMKVYNELEELAAENEDSVDKTARILLQNAIKERKRKRKNGKEGSSSDNA